jgi:hypothetical protein
MSEILEFGYHTHSLPYIPYNIEPLNQKYTHVLNRRASARFSRLFGFSLLCFSFVFQRRFIS